MFTRTLQLPAPGEDTFFLWGPRQTGKTTLLRAAYRDAFWVDLLKADEYRRYLQNPERLREELAHRSPTHVVIDEVQKVPALLDEIHWLHERRGLRFALCGSSVRKVRHGGANLLGGRALRYELHGLTASELGREFDLDRLLDRGYLPRVFGSTRPRQLLESYVADYLKEEVAAEGLVRKLPTFSTFLEAAALSDTERRRHCPTRSWSTAPRSRAIAAGSRHRPSSRTSTFSSTPSLAAGCRPTPSAPSGASSARRNSISATSAS